MKKKVIWLIVILGIGFFGYKFFFSKSNKFSVLDFDTEMFVKGDIAKTVTATGTINPVNVISVGTQVSGTIKKIHVDFNDIVTKDQILAELDTSILQKEVDGSLSNLNKTKANLDYVKLNKDRTKTLYKNKYIAKVELDQAEKEYKTAKEEHDIAKSQYEISQTNFEYAIIKSPVSGVVISRDIDVGQTVASSLQAPTLFQIAEDLKKMQIETSVSEADIGVIKKGQQVDFTVDAYPRKDFKGIIKQIRLNPITEQNVVTYNVIIEIDNKENLLLPGMTAFVSVVVDSVENVLKISNMALRFRPDEKLLKIMKLKPIEVKNKKQNMVYTLKGEKIEQIIITKGLSNINYTEIISDKIKKGDVIITEYFDKERRKNKRKK